MYTWKEEEDGLVSTLVRVGIPGNGEEDGLVSTLVRAGIPGREKRMGW